MCDKKYIYLTKFIDIIFFQQVFLERLGCFFVENKRIAELQGPLSEMLKECSSAAWSRGLKIFALRNGSECLGEKHFPSVFPLLNTSKGCHGGRGGQNVSDVYRLRGKI